MNKGREMKIARRAVGAMLVAVIAVLAVTGPAVAGKKKKPKPKPKPTYQLVFKVEKASYGSTISGAGVSISESDNFKATATYTGITIPHSGAVSIKRHSQHEDFSSDGLGPAWEKTGSSGLDCRGELESDLTLPPFLKGSSAKGKLSLQVELAKSVVVRNATGHTATELSCNETPYYPDGSIAFYPAAVPHPESYMPKMLTAQIEVELAKVRGLKDGGKPITVPVNSTDNGLVRPPANCATPGGETCTQQLGWKGVIEITRTG